MEDLLAPVAVRDRPAAPVLAHVGLPQAVGPAVVDRAHRVKTAVLVVVLVATVDVRIVRC